MTRRNFVATGTTMLAWSARQAAAAQVTPWYRRTYRWGQTNITEADAVRYDIAWWRDFWKRTQVQGVIINAGGIACEPIGMSAKKGLGCAVGIHAREHY